MKKHFEKRIPALFIALLLVLSFGCTVNLEITPSSAASETVSTAVYAIKETAAGIASASADTKESVADPASANTPIPLEATDGDTKTEPKAETRNASLYDRLCALDGVTKVTEITNDPKNIKNTAAARYMLEFSQPIDWNNPALGTFSQRVFLGFKDESKPVCFCCNGYMLDDITRKDYYRTYNGSEPAVHYDANFVDIEYRFFGKSKPENLNVKDPAYWQYLTCENASKDFHHIITELKKIMPGSTLFTGISKGGYTTENMAYYFPDDIDAYVSYVSPLCDGDADSRFYENIYTAIGDLTYGKEQAKVYRDEVTQLQVLLLEEQYREIIQPRFLAKFDGKEHTLSPLVSGDEAYEFAVLETAVNIWQYDQDFKRVEGLLAMDDSTPEAFQKKCAALEKFIYDNDSVSDAECNGIYDPYSYQCYTEMGNYSITFSYLRKAGANIKTPVENEKDLNRRMSIPYFLDCAQYSSAHRRSLIDFFNTTEKDIIKIVGLSDTWYAVRAPETANEHIHLFPVAGSHKSDISKMTEEDRATVYSLIDGLLGIETEEMQKAA